jgi:drug/metabolite transporter (DMT)-like permease
MPNFTVAMLLGIAGSVLYHISKGMQRQSIDVLSLVFRKKRSRTEEVRRSLCGKNVALYSTGFILNNSLGFFAILANRHAPSSYYTSMFGVGIVALMLYAKFILKEPIHPLQYAGAAVLTTGTLLLGYDGIRRDPMTMAGIDLPAAGLIIGAVLLIGTALYVHARRTRSLLVFGVVCGLLIGFAAGLDPVLKGIGQNLGGTARYLPKLASGWIIFMSSFLFATLSFAASQWVFSRGVRASVLIPSQNTAYILFPLVIQVVALPGFKLTILTVVGMAVTLAGIVIMQGRIAKT